MQRRIPMDLEKMGREELIRYIEEMNDYMDNVIVFWGGKREFQETFRQVAENKNHEYEEEEARNAAVLLHSEGAFEEFIQLVRDSFERGGINYMLSEKVSAIMEELASKRRLHS
jgi:Mg/Co/Ni transporter MgtE